MGFPAGIIDFFRGRFLASNRNNYVEIKAPATVSQNHAITLPGEPPIGTKALQINSAGQISYYDASVGSVSSVAIAVPSSLFTSPVSGSPITTTGTFDLQLSNQAVNRVFASPASGASATPTFRGLVIADFSTLPRIDQWGLPQAPVSFNNQQITNVADPVNSQDVATKAYSDASRAGLTVKAPVRAATSSNITLSGIQTIDGVAVASGDRVLVKNQISAQDNGIYICQASSWVRSTDADNSTKMITGTSVFVDQGAINKDTNWVLITDAPITLGTTALTFSLNSRAGEIIDGSGLVKTGNTLNIGTESVNRIVVNADSIDLAAIAGLTPGIYSQVTVDSYGRVVAASNPAFTRVARASFTNSNLSAGLYTFTHNLGQQVVNIQVNDNANKVLLPDEIILTSLNETTIDMTSYAGFTGTYNIIAVG